MSALVQNGGLIEDKSHHDSVWDKVVKLLDNQNLFEQFGAHLFFSWHSGHENSGG